VYVPWLPVLDEQWQNIDQIKLPFFVYVVTAFNRPAFSYNFLALAGNREKRTKCFRIEKAIQGTERTKTRKWAKECRWVD
jgi:hypothetical protein